MAELVRRVIPRRFICGQTYQSCCAANCHSCTGIVEYMKQYLGCPSRMPEERRR